MLKNTLLSKGFLSLLFLVVNLGYGEDDTETKPSISILDDDTVFNRFHFARRHGTEDSKVRFIRLHWRVCRIHLLEQYPNGAGQFRARALDRVDDGPSILVDAGCRARRVRARRALCGGPDGGDHQWT